MLKIKAVWLCHMANDALNRYFDVNLNTCAYWMTQFIDLMKDNLEIHVVAPNYYNNKDLCFEINGVNYHLFKYYSGIGSTRIAYCEIALRQELNIQRKVKEIVRDVNPDIVHLFGAENITYSSGILPFIGKLPTVVSFQGYIQLAEKKGNFLRKLVINKRVKTEDSILRKCPNISFGTFETSSEKYYKDKYGEGKIYPINFPFKFPNVDATTVEKEYDIVFWGRVTYEKGVEDLIQTVSILKKELPHVRCLILGGGSEEYMLRLQELVEKNSLSNNIIFGGFQKTDDQLFQNASKAKLYALPTHFDALPGSIRESMALRLPVVAYAVGDIPSLNKDKECIALVKPLDVQELAKTIYTLLTKDERREMYIKNSQEAITLASSDESVKNQILSCYKSILS